MFSIIIQREQRFRVFENKMLRNIFETKRDEFIGEWRMLSLQ